MNKSYFRAQALAIVMVVLVVASIIGMALFSRMSKDKQAAIDEQNSAAAAELAESIIDIVISADIDVLESHAGSTKDNLSELKEFISDPIASGGLGMDLTSVPFPSEGWCIPEENSSFEFSIDLLGPSEEVTVGPGELIAYHIQGATPTNPCVLSVTFSTNESDAVFIVKKTYGGVFADVVDNYCMCSGICAAGCDDIDDVEDYNHLTDWGASHTEEFDLEEADLAEIRILPIKGSISIASSMANPSCIDRQFNYVKVTTEANCNGSYRAKEIKLPGSGNLGYSTLFDYGIYDTGDFRLKH